MIIHKCDLCNEENKNMTTIKMPINKYMYVMKNGVKLTKFKSSVELSDIEVCPTCTIKIANYLDSFGVSC